MILLTHFVDQLQLKLFVYQDDPKPQRFFFRCNWDRLKENGRECAQRSKDGELVPRPAGSSKTLLATVRSHKIGKTPAPLTFEVLSDV